jgi:hypothetical protein
MIQLTEELGEGEGIKVSYRTNLTDAYAELAIFDYDTQGAVSSHTFPASDVSGYILQIKIELKTGSAPSSYTKLKNISFI